MAARRDCSVLTGPSPRQTIAWEELPFSTGTFRAQGVPESGLGMGAICSSCFEPRQTGAPEEMDAESVVTIDMRTKGDGFAMPLTEKGVEKRIGELDDPDTVVISGTKAVVITVDYPLENPAEVTVAVPAKGLTRRELYLAIATAYQQTYAEEEETTSVPVETVAERAERLGLGGVHLINRAPTDGKHGIWGHVLDDLVLVSVDYDKNTGRAFLGVDS